jgi:hypothetical protein
MGQPVSGKIRGFYSGSRKSNAYILIGQGKGRRGVILGDGGLRYNAEYPVVAPFTPRVSQADQDQGALELVPCVADRTKVSDLQQGALQPPVVGKTSATVASNLLPDDGAQKVRAAGNMHVGVRGIDHCVHR